MPSSSEIKGHGQRVGFMFVSEKWNPPSVIRTVTGMYREATLPIDQGNFYNFGLFVSVHVCVCTFCMGVYYISSLR